jgi:hypothetical protein
VDNNSAVLLLVESELRGDAPMKGFGKRMAAKLKELPAGYGPASRRERSAIEG